MRNLLAEAWFQSEGQAFEYHEMVKLEEIDAAASLKNQARQEPILDQTVEKYILAMIDGNQFPALIGFAGPRGYILNDGNQRLEASRTAVTGGGTRCCWPHRAPGPTSVRVA